MTGYKITIDRQLSKRECYFEWLGSRKEIEEDLIRMGFTRWEVLAAKFIAMNAAEIKKAQELDIE